jgi:hypothetical protein
MSISNITKEFELWYIEEELQNQAVYCHELAHVVIWIDGAPSAYTVGPVSIRDEHTRRAWELVSHISVWHFVKEMGFDEAPVHTPCIECCIRAISQGIFHSGVFPGFVIPRQALDLAFALAGPATEAARDRLRSAARDMFPKALELAESIVAHFESRPCLSPQEYTDALIRLLRLLKTPTEGLKPSFVDKTAPGFRSRILAAARM